jgi:hypothetical protein
LYDEWFQEWAVAHKAFTWSELPDRVIGAIGKLILQSKEPDHAILRLLRNQQPAVYRAVTLGRGLIYLQRLIEEQPTEESIERNREERFRLLSNQDLPLQVIEIFLPRPQMPTGAPRGKRDTYFRALDYKVEHPEVSWPQLARKFDLKSGAATALKAWCFTQKRRLGALGLELSLENPNYRRTRR